MGRIPGSTTGLRGCTPRRRVHGGVATLGACMALLFGGAVLVAPPSMAKERTFHRTGTDDPSTVDPHKIAFPGEQLVVLDLFMGLTTSDIRGGRPVPGCAESWTISPDGRRYVFRLRPGLQWSDGVPMSATDFVWSFRRALDPATAFPFASRLYPIRNARSIAAGKLPVESLGVTAPDARTVRIDLEGPTPYFTDVIASIGVPAPRHAIEKFGSAWIRPRNFVSNGPFTLERWVPNAYLRLRKNPRFFAAASVRLDAVHHYPVENPVTMVRRFQSGGLDLVYVLPPERVEWAKREFGSAVRVGRGTANEVLVFNTRQGPTADVRVRRALSMAMDREAIASNVIGFPGVEAWGYVPPGIANYGAGAKPDFAAWTQARRNAEARRLLAEAGFGAARPLKIRLAFPSTELNRKVAVTIATLWRRIGVVPELAQKETKSLVADVARGDFDAARFVWLAGFSDPYAFLERMLSSGSAVGVNASRYANPAFDALLARATQEVDLVRRAAILREAEALALADQPVAPVYYLVGRRLVSRRTSGFVDNPRGLYPSWYMTVPPR
jgi:oligopeptide transport system substrate-binding protein